MDKDSRRHGPVCHCGGLLRLQTWGFGGKLVRVVTGGSTTTLHDSKRIVTWFHIGGGAWSSQWSAMLPKAQDWCRDAI
eukprot:1396488-Karenia_brevis.AAC.1